MKVILTRLLYIHVLLIVFPLHAESLVWKVTKGNDYLYIGGTIHMLAKKDYPLPVEYERAYRKVSQLVLETDMQRLQQPEVQAQLLKQMTYQGSDTLEKHLKPATWKKLSAYLQKKHVSIESFRSFKPAMVILTITLLEVMEQVDVNNGVDTYFSNRALQDGKVLGKLETVEEQLAFLVSMGEGNEDEAILYTLQEAVHFREMFMQMKNAWKAGDLEAFKDIALYPMQKDFPDVYQSLLVSRNNAWLPRIEALLTTPEIEMVLVGALHLVGKESLLAKLKTRGYQVERL
ncbi:MAG: TraB/GumN family protein [Gammaproteobacteria bacterium]